MLDQRSVECLLPECYDVRIGICTDGASGGNVAGRCDGRAGK